MKVLYEKQDPKNPGVQIEYVEHVDTYQCFGLSCSVPQPGDRIQPLGGPLFEIVSAHPYGSGFQGLCKICK